MLNAYYLLRSYGQRVGAEVVVREATNHAAHNFITLGTGEGARALSWLDDALTDPETHKAADATDEALALTARTTLGVLPTAATQAATIRRAVCDDATRRVYITEGGHCTVDMPQMAGPTSPPPPVNCQLSERDVWPTVPPWSARVADQRSQQRRGTRSILVLPANGGAVCSPTQETQTQTVTHACIVTPPSVTGNAVPNTIASAPIPLPLSGDVTMCLFIVTMQYSATLMQFPGLRIPGASRDLRNIETHTLALNGQ